MSVVAFIALLLVLRWLILGRMPEGMALMGRKVDALEERIRRLEAEAAGREQTPS